MYQTEEQLEKEIANVMSNPQLILPSEKPSRDHDRIEAIIYLHVRVFEPMWQEILAHPPPRAAKKSWL